MKGIKFFAKPNFWFSLDRVLHILESVMGCQPWLVQAWKSGSEGTDLHDLIMALRASQGQMGSDFKRGRVINLTITSLNGFRPF